MWAAYLVFLVLAVVRAAKLQYCQELILKGSALRKDVATMVFTIDSTCVACYREIQKLVRLKTQMARLGHNADIMVALNQLSRDHKHKLPSEVTVDLEDAWTKLGQLNGHIFVFDKCGKLAYQVITPWSRQVYPFTAMAGLSALYDVPCGECNVTSQATMDELQEVSESSDGAGSQGNKLPLTITIRERQEHIHNGNRVTYDILELNTNDPNYHGHGATTQGSSEPETKDSTPNATIVRMNETQTEGGMRHTSQENNGSSSVSQERKSGISQERKSGTSQESKSSISLEINSVMNVTKTTTEPPASQDDYSKLLKRYQPLMKWRTCANLVMSIQV